MQSFGEQRGYSFRHKTAVHAVPFGMPLLPLLLLLLGLFCRSGAGVLGSAGNSPQGQPLSVHLIAHSHCDAGWKLTYEEYYEQKVHRILHNVFRDLMNDPEKRFIWSEVSFFSKWFESLPQIYRDNVTKLAKQGRLEIVNGGWVMMDEASSLLESQINQLTTGHEYISRNFGIKPRVAWQIDPFGHSRSTAAIFKLSGYIASVNDRIPLKIKDSRKQTKDLQYKWRSFGKLGESSDLLTHTLDSWYWMPSGIRWEDGDPPVDDKNIRFIADELVREFKNRHSYFSTNELLFPFGSDFSFQDSRVMFTNMDKLISYINSNPEYNVHMMYSTLSDYFGLVIPKLSRLNTFDQDYFPFEDFPWGGFWGGHYSSRPALKQQVRQHDSMLQSLETVTVIGRQLSELSTETYPHDVWSVICEGRNVSGLLNHHDAITGTSNKRVVNDYSQKLFASYFKMAAAFSDSLKFILAQHLKDYTSYSVSTYFDLGNDARSTVWEIHLNSPLHIVIFNHKSRERSQFVDIRADLMDVCKEYCKHNIQIRDSKNKMIEGQIYPDSARALAGSFSGVQSSLISFKTNIPPLGFETYTLELKRIDEDGAQYPGDVTKLGYDIAPCGFKNNSFSISNEHFTLHFSGENGHPTKVVDINHASVDLNISILRYRSSKSGAYLFMPEGKAEPLQIGCPKEIRIIKTPLVEEVFHQLHNNATQYFRLYRNTEGDFGKMIHYGFQNTGPIAPNTELIVNIESAIKNKGAFYNHNGLEYVKNIFDESSWPDYKIASNYKPLNTHAFINDTNYVISVFSQQSHGMTSTGDGQMEIMIHRRLMQDDHMGLDEAMDDTSCISVRFGILLKPAQDNNDFSMLSETFTHPLQLALVKAENISSMRSHFTLSDVSRSAGKVIYSVQLRSFISGEVMFRLQNFAGNTDLFVNGSSLFEPLSVVSHLKEHSLTLLDALDSHLDPDRIRLSPGWIRTFTGTPVTRKCTTADYLCSFGFVKKGDTCVAEPSQNPYKPPNPCKDSYIVRRYAIDPLALCRHGSVSVDEILPCPTTGDEETTGFSFSTFVVVLVGVIMSLSVVTYTIHRSKTYLLFQMRSVNDMPHLQQETVMLLRGSRWDEDADDDFDEGTANTSV